MTPRASEMRCGRNFLRTDDPCRVRGKRGMWRFVAALLDEAGAVTGVELVGPVADPYNPRTRTFRVEQVRRVQRSEANLAAVARR